MNEKEITEKEIDNLPAKEIDEILEEIKGKSSTKDIAEILSLYKDSDDSRNKEISDLLTHLKELNDATDKRNDEFISQLKNEFKNLIEYIKEGTNQEEIIKTLNELKNLKVNFPSEMRVKNMPDMAVRPKWLDEIKSGFVEILKFMGLIKKQGLNVDVISSPRNPVAVRLSDGEKFYNAILTAISGGGGSPYRNIHGVAVDVVLTADGKIPVDTVIDASDIEIGAIEIKDGNSDTRAVVGSLGLQVDQQPLPTIYNNTKTVPTVTAEAIAGAQAIHSVTIKTLSTNTVAVYVGGSGVTTTTGVELLPDESITIDVNDLSKVFVISGSASQVVRFLAL